MITVHLSTHRATYYHPDGTVNFTRHLYKYDPTKHTFTNEDGHTIHLGTPLRQDGSTLTYRATPSINRTSPRRFY